MSPYSVLLRELSLTSGLLPKEHSNTVASVCIIHSFLFYEMPIF